MSIQQRVRERCEFTAYKYIYLTLILCTPFLKNNYSCTQFSLSINDCICWFHVHDCGKNNFCVNNKCNYNSLDVLHANYYRLYKY